MAYQWSPAYYHPSHLSKTLRCEECRQLGAERHEAQNRATGFSFCVTLCNDCRNDLSEVLSFKKM